VAKPRQDSDPSPNDIEVAGIIAVHEIDQRSWEDTDALLSAVLCAAWPSLHAQNQ
jgi:hypothetical protein